MTEVPRQAVKTAIVALALTLFWFIIAPYTLAGYTPKAFEEYALYSLVMGLIMGVVYFYLFETFEDNSQPIANFILMTVFFVVALSFMYNGYGMSDFVLERSITIEDDFYFRRVVLWASFSAPLVLWVGEALWEKYY